MNDQSDNNSTSGNMLEGADVRRKARDDFARVVAEAVDRLITVHGCSRERATALVLREIVETLPISGSNSELSFVKQHYRLSHIQATRALAVSTAIKNLVQKENLSQSEAVKRLTLKLTSASFSNVSDGTANVDSNSPSVTNRKASEISIPQMQKHQQQPVKPPIKTPLKKARSSGKLSAKAVVKSARKRSIDEIGTNHPHQLSAEPQSGTEARARTDSVAEAVTAKLKHQEPNLSTENIKPGSRNKRSRGGSSGLEDSDSGSNTKRARPSSA